MTFMSHSVNQNKISAVVGFSKGIFYLCWSPPGLSDLVTPQVDTWENSSQRNEEDRGRRITPHTRQ